MSNLSPRQWVGIVVGIIFAIYIISQAQAILFGPRVSIESPRDGAVVSSSVVTLTGTARNAAWISLNDRQIFTDEKGVWEEKLILSPGLSIMTVRVRDRFGREAERQVKIIFN